MMRTVDRAAYRRAHLPVVAQSPLAAPSQYRWATWATPRLSGEGTPSAHLQRCRSGSDLAGHPKGPTETSGGCPNTAVGTPTVDTDAREAGGGSSSASPWQAAGVDSAGKYPQAADASTIGCTASTAIKMKETCWRTHQERSRAAVAVAPFGAFSPLHEWQQCSFCRQNIGRQDVRLFRQKFQPMSTEFRTECRDKCYNEELYAQHRGGCLLPAGRQEPKGESHRVRLGRSGGTPHSSHIRHAGTGTVEPVACHCGSAAGTLRSCVGGLQQFSRQDRGGWEQSPTVSSGTPRGRRASSTRCLLVRSCAAVAARSTSARTCPPLAAASSGNVARRCPTAHAGSPACTRSHQLTHGVSTPFHVTDGESTSLAAIDGTRVRSEKHA